MRAQRLQSIFLHREINLPPSRKIFRPDVVPGIPFYWFGKDFSGGKALNPAAFTKPPTAEQGIRWRQGHLGEFARGFGATQWEFRCTRDFPIRGEALKMQFRRKCSTS